MSQLGTSMVEVGEKFEIGWMFRVGTLSAAMNLPTAGREISPLQLCRCRCSVAVSCWLFSIGGVEGGRPGSKEQRGEFRGVRPGWWTAARCRAGGV